MTIDTQVKLSFRIDSDNIPFEIICEQFSFLVREANNLLGGKNVWYETGYSKKQALSHIAFENESINDEVFKKWQRRYKKDFPLFIERVWDGKGDYSSSVQYGKPFYNDIKRVNVELSIVSDGDDINMISFIRLLSTLASTFDCSYINAESNGYRFHGKNVFPDRISVGWMLYIPHILLPELIPEAARVVPVIDSEKQKGTIVVSTEEIFDGNNKEHIGRANDIEIKLLDLGLLPLMTEL
jgi:hypothetical protein